MIVDRINAEDEEEFRQLAAFLIPMASEVSVVPVDIPHMTREGWKAIAEGNSWAAWSDGNIVGALLLVKRPFMENPAFTYLTNMIFYVAPSQRFAMVGRRLLQAARDDAQPRSAPILIEIRNRMRAAKLQGETMYATLAGFLPVGHIAVVRKMGVLTDA